MFINYRNIIKELLKEYKTGLLKNFFKRVTPILILVYICLFFFMPLSFFSIFILLIQVPLVLIMLLILSIIKVLIIREYKNIKEENFNSIFILKETLEINSSIFKMGKIYNVCLTELKKLDKLSKFLTKKNCIITFTLKEFGLIYLEKDILNIFFNLDTYILNNRKIILYLMSSNNRLLYKDKNTIEVLKIAYSMNFEDCMNEKIISSLFEEWLLLASICLLENDYTLSNELIEAFYNINQLTLERRTKPLICSKESSFLQLTDSIKKDLKEYPNLYSI
ncbi:hypothetical protein NBN67_19380 [Clostridioides difficile]|nr:hypothetical protein [Clostridioides difficile]HBF2930507.1 hypothetical protein [Clostridioides difficile]HBF2935891.1 hypothetical protein [Clostridioides difficile]HBZ0282687.1 hypothetical protein [Clostridioides difficile]